MGSYEAGHLGKMGTGEGLQRIVQQTGGSEEAAGGGRGAGEAGVRRRE